MRELRQARRWTQKQAGKACHLGQKHYQLFEIGVKTNPELRTIEKIARGFGLEVHEFLAPTSARVRRRSPITRIKKKQKRRRRTKKRQ